MTAPEPTAPACTECGALAQTSRPVGVTDLGPVEFFDEEGRHHLHDPNCETVSYTCRNGHEFKVSTRRKCWCGKG